MAARGTPVTPEELAAAREVLARADHFGVNTKVGKRGSMNNSSKRLRDRDHARPKQMIGSQSPVRTNCRWLRWCTRPRCTRLGNDDLRTPKGGLREAHIQ